METKKSPKQVAQNARDYVAFWLKNSGKTARNVAKSSTVIATMCLDYTEFFQDMQQRYVKSKLRKVPYKDLEYAFTELLEVELQRELAEAMPKLRCENEDLEPLREWVKAVTGSNDDKNVMVMAHWIWQVKRKGLELPVKHQIMPVLYGLQGGGKTVAIERLISPIEQFKLAISMHQLADERAYEGMSNNFVIVFDELQGVERTDMNSLKKQITATHNTYRKLHTHTVLNVPMRCSFIGATNKPLQESITDSTGMRRFWEVVTLPKLDWKVVTEIDYTELWLGVDDKLEDGYLKGDALVAVSAEQTNYVNKEPLDEFMLDAMIAPDAENPNTIEVSCTQLYEKYIHWSGKNGITSRLTKPWFVRKLSRKLEARMGRSKEGRQTFFKINADNIFNEEMH